MIENSVIYEDDIKHTMEGNGRHNTNVSVEEIALSYTTMPYPLKVLLPVNVGYVVGDMCLFAKVNCIESSESTLCRPCICTDSSL